MTIKEIATEYIDYFEYRTRNNGDKFFALKDNRPQELRDLVYSAHDNGEHLPCDYKYAFIHDALCTLQEYDDPEEAIHGIEPDINNYDLLRWVGSHVWRAEYVDEAVEEMEYKNLFSALGWGQYKERSEVFYSVLSSLQDIAEEGEAA